METNNCSPLQQDCFSESFFIGIFQDNWEKSSWHYHNHYEISFTTEGSGMLHFLKIMDIIGQSETLVHLASKEYLKGRFTTANKRIAAIHEYFMHNYREDVNLERLAGLVNMAQGSLCRYFKQNMGLTIFEYLNKIKTEFACKLLMDPDLTVFEVCLDSGFNNLSHFNKQFRKFAGATPMEYRKRFKGLA